LPTRPGRGNLTPAPGPQTLEGAATHEAPHCLLPAGRSRAIVERMHAAHPGAPAGSGGADPRAIARREIPDEPARPGRERWALTQIPYGDLPCHNCHPETYADGTTVDQATYEPGCRDCHAAPGDEVPQDRCLECHENGLYGYSVHREVGLECMDCHTSNDVHGNGRIMETMYDPDAIEANCIACHAEVSSDSLAAHEIHFDTVDCSACHIETSETCYSCHFESYVEGGYQDRVLTQHDGFIMLVNRKNGKVHPATYQTTPWKGKSFVGILPTFSHTVRKAEDARGCGDCHANDAVDEYARTGRIWVAKWNEESKSLWLRKGVIPVPPNWPNVRASRCG